jgi:hypothetical protein
MIKVENYRLFAGNGRYIRTATKVIFADGSEIKFIEKLSKKAAIANAQYQTLKLI